jgi:hypothetical protein
MKIVFALIGLALVGALALAQVFSGSNGVKRMNERQLPAQSQLTIKIQTDKTSYKLGEPVKISLSVTNPSEQEMIIRFNSGQYYDFWVQKDGKEVWRWSRGKAFIQAFTSITLKAGETKTFSDTWKQLTNDGEQTAPGAYAVFGQLTTVPPRPQPISAQITIGTARAAVEETTIRAIIDNVDAAVGRTVSVRGTYLGWRPDPDAPACKDGPPVMRSDWAVSDGTGCIFATGRSGLDPSSDYGKSITLIGTVRKTDKGQPYIEAQTVRIRE